MVTPTDTAILKKIAKKTKIGTYDPIEVVKALNIADPGWDIAPSKTTIAASGNIADRFMRLWSIALGLGDSQEYTDVPAGMDPVFLLSTDYISFGFSDADNQPGRAMAITIAKDVLAKVSRPLTKTPSTPQNTEVDGLYVGGFNPTYNGIYHDNVVAHLVKPRLGVTAWVIKSPKGDEFVLPVVPPARSNRPGNPRQMANPQLWTWLYKQTDAPAKVAEYLNSPDSLLQQQSQQRSKEIKKAGGSGIGTCAVCDKLYKLERKRTHGDLPVMVHHGYRRPGIGYIVGDCFGVSYPPYELSAVGCEKYLVALAKSIDHQRQAVQRISSRTEWKVWLSYSVWYDPMTEYKLVTIHRNGTVTDHGKVMTHREISRMKTGEGLTAEEFAAHKSEFLGHEGLHAPAVKAKEGTDPVDVFKLRQSEDILDATRRLQQIEAEQANMEKRVRNWTLQPLPGEVTASVHTAMAIDMAQVALDDVAAMLS